jgi:hypothetical protein
MPFGNAVGEGFTNSGIVIANKVIIFGANEGLWVYNGTPGLGNPPIFWASSGASDPYGNPLTATAGVSGTGIFQAGTTLINPDGIFTYGS